MLNVRQLLEGQCDEKAQREIWDMVELKTS